MAISRVLSREAAEEKTFEKLRRDNYLTPDNHINKARIKAKFDDFKKMMQAKRVS